MDVPCQHLGFTPITSADLDALRDICRRKQRTTEFLAGKVLHEWIQRQEDRGGPGTKSKTKEVEKD